MDEGEGRRGWLLLRQSLHDPLLVLNVESDRQGGEQQGLRGTGMGADAVCQEGPAQVCQSSDCTEVGDSGF